MRLRWLPLPLLAAALAMPGAADADWLLLKDGHRVETRGAYTVRGKTVVFTSTAGVLSSLRLDAVDLEASRSASQPAAPTGVPKAAARKPGRRLVFQDGNAAPQPAAGDLAKQTEETNRVADPKAPGDPVAAASGGAKDDAPAAPSTPLTVTWERGRSESGTAIIGTLVNGGQSTSVNISVQVLLLDSEGTTIESKAATLTTTALAPGRTSSFRADFPEISTFADVRCDVTSTNLKISN
jgi:hypothetical protein